MANINVFIIHLTECYNPNVGVMRLLTTPFMTASSALTRRQWTTFLVFSLKMLLDSSCRNNNNKSTAPTLE